MIGINSDRVFDIGALLSSEHLEATGGGVSQRPSHCQMFVNDFAARRFGRAVRT